MLILDIMTDNFPSPKQLEKEIGEFLTERYGENVKLVSPVVIPVEEIEGKDINDSGAKPKLNFDLLPEDLATYLDQYIIKQDKAKDILATKICTHFNRIKYMQETGVGADSIVGGVKNNIMMVGPTGVGKTYMIKLIAQKIGVPFVKGDATKFSETGYVGGDVDDLVRDLVREADDDIELAQYGIIYIDEIDKIASSRNLIGADISRTGVQRALLKPMEETDIEMKVPHDPVSMFQEIERFRKTGKRESSTINTRNILFIMSGAFGDISDIIQKRLYEKTIGFGADVQGATDSYDILKHIKSEDLIEYGFESEFVGRVPVRSVFERLTEDDLFEILRNSNNPIILGKKLDFKAYGIDVRFEDEFLRATAKEAFTENTGARGLVSALEGALLRFERGLPSADVSLFPATARVFEQPEKYYEDLTNPDKVEEIKQIHEEISNREIEFIRDYINKNKTAIADRHKMTLTPARIETLASYYCKNMMDIDSVIGKIKPFLGEIKQIELHFLKEYGINIIFEEDAIDYIMEQFVLDSMDPDYFLDKIAEDFENGLKLIREMTHINRFFITREGLINPNSFLDSLIKKEIKKTELEKSENDDGSNNDDVFDNENKPDNENKLDNNIGPDSDSGPENDNNID